MHRLGLIGGTGAVSFQGSHQNPLAEQIVQPEHPVAPSDALTIWVSWFSPGAGGRRWNWFVPSSFFSSINGLRQWENGRTREKLACGSLTFNFCCENRSTSKKMGGFLKKLLTGEEEKVSCCAVPNGVDSVLKLEAKNSKWPLFLDMRNANGHWVQLNTLLVAFLAVLCVLAMANHAGEARL